MTTSFDDFDIARLMVVIVLLTITVILMFYYVDARLDRLEEKVMTSSTTYIQCQPTDM